MHIRLLSRNDALRAWISWKFYIKGYFFSKRVSIQYSLKIETVDSLNVVTRAIVACNCLFYQDFGTIDLATAVSVRCGTILAYSNNFKFHIHKKKKQF